MKRNYLLLCLLFVLGTSVQMFAQTDPGIANLKHRWTFDNGSLVDDVAGTTGTIVGNGSVANNAFVATNAYLELPASEIAINTYPAFTTEVWCTSQAGANAGWSLLTFFGESVNGGGRNFTFLSIARGDNQTMVGIEAPNWNGVTGQEYDDGKIHHFVYTVSPTGITLFIDGNQISSAPLTETNSIANLSNSLAYIGRGGWPADPNWVGSYHKVSLFDKALSADEVLYLFQQGAEESSVITATASNIVLDNNFPATTFNVTASNLSSPITFTSPQGISLFSVTGQPITAIPADATNYEVVAMWDMSAPADGDIVFTSGSASTTLKVKAVSDTECFNMLYDDVQNLFMDISGMNKVSDFSGWGSREVITAISDPENVYCGANSIKIGNGTTTGSGSLDILGGITSILLPNTIYKGRIMIKTIGGTFHLGVDAGPNIEFTIDTNGEWKPLDFMFTTGANVGANMYINNWACTGLAAYVDNYELYIAPEPIIKPSEKALAFDPEYKTAKFNVTASNIFEDITILAPSGITVSPTTLPADSKGAEVTVTWDGTTAVDGKIALSASSGLAEVVIKTIGASNTTCFSPLYADKTNLMPEPYMNNASAFGGWGGKGFISIIDNPDSVYCGSHSARIIGSGSVDVQLAGIIKKNTPYIARVMLRTLGGSYQLGVGGMDVNGAASDVNAVYDTQGAWQPVTLEFTTGDSLRINDQPFFINNWQLTGTRAFIDNLELYEKEPNAVIKVADLIRSVYVSNGKIVAEFDLTHAAVVDFAIYNIQGAMISNVQKSFTTGRNRNVFETALPNGVYLVRMIQDGKTQFTKVIK